MEFVRSTVYHYEFLVGFGTFRFSKIFFTILNFFIKKVPRGDGWFSSPWRIET